MTRIVSLSRIARIAALTALASCNEGGLSAPPSRVASVVNVTLPAAASCPPSAPPPAPPDPIAAYADTFGITGNAESDTCGSLGLYLAAQKIAVSPSHELFADVVNRTYDARATPAGLTAAGDFAAPECPGEKLHETWAFAPAGNAMEGVLVSEWPVAPECVKTCRVVFAIHATRMER